ncbi:MAG: Maf family nucleotide pyrophosphatase [Bacteroidales bacterium]|nr:Maf family nucleotide pyrophosphatase [Bacteroidales bacterium]
MKRIILGSNSPRRRELLAGLDIDFTVDTGNGFEELVPPGLEAHKVPEFLSRGKSHGFHRTLESDEVLITSDTVVIVDRTVLGKPHTRDEAVRMLRMLSGRAHEVVTAVTLRDSVREETFSVSTRVHFVELQQAEIDHYIDKYKPFDKAGAYGIQEWIGYVGISSIEGSFYNVMGFPVHRVWQELQHFL